MRLQHFLLFTILFLMTCSTALAAKEVPIGLPLGYAVNIQSISTAKIKYAKSLGIDYIELANVGSLLDADLNLKYDADYWRAKMKEIKTILDAEGMRVWSVHMPFSKSIDISILQEDERIKVINAHLQLAEVLALLKPTFLLFHPSYYLEVNRREERIAQLVASVNTLDQELNKLGMQVVVENMLGPELRVGAQERPLLRTIAECEYVFAKLPPRVGLAVDMCHIMHAELLIVKFGSRVKTLHVSDGDGLGERHYLPCTQQGKNNWNLILEALDKINYTGVFMYECKFTDEKELKECYDLLRMNYNHYKLNNKRI